MWVRLGEHVAALEDSTAARDEEITMLQQEVLRLREQHLDLQTHTEDLENRSRRNNVRIRAVPTGAEDGDLVGYVQDLFCKILGSSSDSTIKIDRCHRVGPHASPIVPLRTS